MLVRPNRLQYHRCKYAGRGGFRVGSMRGANVACMRPASSSGYKEEAGCSVD